MDEIKDVKAERKSSSERERTTLCIEIGEPEVLGSKGTMDGPRSVTARRMTSLQCCCVTYVV
jgi:hypothetical protein